MGSCRNCIKATPFASLIAMIVTVCGVGIFCFTLYFAIDYTLRGILEDTMHLKIPWLNGVNIFFIILGASMGVYAVLLLVFGALATGGTRNRVYKGAKCIMGGRISAAFFLVLTYILNLAWLFVIGSLMVPLMAYVMTKSICTHELQGSSHKIDGSPNAPHLAYNPNCFNITRFGVYLYPDRAYDPYHDRVELPEGQAYKGKDFLCEPEEIRLLCDYMSHAGPLFVCAILGAVLITIGLSMFQTILATAYTRIRLTKELTQYRQIIDRELRLEDINRSRASGLNRSTASGLNRSTAGGLNRSTASGLNQSRPSGLNRSRPTGLNRSRSNDLDRIPLRSESDPFDD